LLNITGDKHVVLALHGIREPAPDAGPSALAENAT